MAPGVSLITPTRDRPFSLQLAEKYMARQTYDGPIQWIIVDDGTQAFRPTLGQHYVRRPSSESPLASFLDNLRAACQCVAHDRILIIEDDDWYRRDYVALAVHAFETHALVGISRAKYYHVGSRRWHVCDNRRHAALCQTGLRREVLPAFLSVITKSDTPFIDKELWRLDGNCEGLCLDDTASISLKGTARDQGLSRWHQAPTGMCDPEGQVLKQWIGAEDAEPYLDLRPR